MLQIERLGALWAFSAPQQCPNPPPGTQSVWTLVLTKDDTGEFQDHHPVRGCWESSSREQGKFTRTRLISRANVMMSTVFITDKAFEEEVMCLFSRRVCLLPCQKNSKLQLIISAGRRQCWLLEIRCQLSLEHQETQTSYFTSLHAQVAAGQQESGPMKKYPPSFKPTEAKQDAEWMKNGGSAKESASMGWGGCDLKALVLHNPAQHPFPHKHWAHYPWAGYTNSHMPWLSSHRPCNFTFHVSDGYSLPTTLRTLGNTIHKDTTSSLAGWGQGAHAGPGLTAFLSIIHLLWDLPDSCSFPSCV